MNLARVGMILGLAAAVPAWAVYAPIPEPEQGEELTVSLMASVYHDSNIFGAPSGAISSMVFEAVPKIDFNASLTAQTFATASYRLAVDHYQDRPGKKTLVSHDLSARLAHAFSSVTTLDLSENYVINQNPQSLLSGVTVNTDQSYRSNEFGGRFETTLGPRVGTALKFDALSYRYDDASLAASIDHDEYLYGGTLFYDLVPELMAVGEFRHQDIRYQTLGSVKDKHTNFLIGGVNYAVAKTLKARFLVGHQWRDREGGESSQAPYAELSVKYDYAEHSFVSAGYVYTYEETTNLALYTDTLVNRFFINLEHALSPLLVASTALTYEPSELQGRGVLPNVAETTTRLGLALTYSPTKNWRTTASFDYDHVNSDDPSRGQQRERVGLSASYLF